MWRIDCRQNNRRKNKNQGSATIEITLLLPVVIGVFYLYIFLFLFLTNCAQSMANMVEVVYVEQEMKSGEKSMEIIEAGSTTRVCVVEEVGIFHKELELHRYNGSPINNIRRWQLAADSILSRGDS